MQQGDRVRLTLKARRRICRELHNINYRLSDSLPIFGTMVFLRLNNWDNNWAIVSGSGFISSNTFLISDLELVK
jgi:hypothetical protein